MLQVREPLPDPVCEWTNFRDAGQPDPLTFDHSTRAQGPHLFAVSSRPRSWPLENVSLRLSSDLQAND